MRLFSYLVGFAPFLRGADVPNAESAPVMGSFAARRMLSQVIVRGESRFVPGNLWVKHVDLVRDGLSFRLTDVTGPSGERRDVFNPWRWPR
jgi:hypothetical protein